MVENERWATSDTPDKLREAVVSLRAASLVAGLDKRIVDFYVQVAGAGWQQSYKGWQHFGDEEAAGIPAVLGDLISNAAAVLAAYAWRPYWRRYFLRRDLHRLADAKAEVTETLADHGNSAIAWDRIWAVRSI